MTTRDGDTGALAVIDRLNSDTRTWSFEIASHLVLDEEVVVLGRLCVDGITKMAFGNAPVSRDAHGKSRSIGFDLKAAANDALARAARLFGVGLVYSKGDAGPREEEREPEAGVSPGERVTQRQLGMIHGLARRKNLRRAELGAMLHDRFRKTELVALTKREASDFIGELGATNGHTAA